MKRILSLTLALLMLFAMVFVASCKQDEAQEGEKTFNVVVVSQDDTEKEFTITTEETIVATALISEGLVEGEDGPYGLYITRVNGEYHKWEDDGKYWAFYIDGEYATTGAEKTYIKDGATYTLKVE